MSFRKKLALSPVGLLSLLSLSACHEVYNLKQGRYRVSSDCPQAPAPAVFVMEVSGGSRNSDDAQTAPYRYSIKGLSAYGMPSDDFVGGLNSTPLTAESDTRICRGRTFRQDDDGVIFLCRDKATGAECVISILAE